MAHHPPADDTDVVRLEHIRQRQQIIGARIAVVVRKGEDLAAGGGDGLIFRIAQRPRGHAECPDGEGGRRRKLLDELSRVVGGGMVDNQQLPCKRDAFEAADRAEEARQP